MKRNDILAVYHQGPEAVVQLVESLCLRIEKLEVRIQQLENQGKKNSKNSHMPPSTDSFAKPAPKSLRSKTGRKPGGQPGHIGHTLRKVKNPDHVIIHRVTACDGCGHSLENVPALRTKNRQVFDLPPLHIEVTQHEAEVKQCPHCQCIHTAMFPKHVSHPVQYGPTLQTLAVYLTQYQLIPYKRATEFFQDVLGHSLSEGTLVSWNHTVQDLLEPVEVAIRTYLQQAPVIHVDETSMRVEGTKQWLHTVTTSDCTLYMIHPKRGKKAMDAMNVLPVFTGIAVHDAFSPYFQYDQCGHALCHAHHLRELTAIWDLHRQPWAKDMIDFLCTVKHEIAQTSNLSPDRITKWEQTYSHLIRRGVAENRLHPISLSEKAGSQKQSVAKNLLDRLSRYQEYALAFLKDRRVPFDNNQAERDIRMAKIKQKISGTFRSIQGSQTFCRIRSLISTARKQKIGVLSIIERCITGKELSLFSK